MLLVHLEIYMSIYRSFNIMYSVPNRLSSAIDTWIDIGANEQVLDWISHGVKLPFIDVPNQFIIQNRNFSSKHYYFIDAEVREMVQKGVLRPVQNRPTCVSPISC